MKIDSDDGVLRLTFDRPDALNALTTETADELADAIEGPPGDQGRDRHHRRGRRLQRGRRPRVAGGDARIVRGCLRGGHRDLRPRVVEAMLECPVPIVAKVNGDAIGAGLSIVALADIAYAAADATFSCAFVRVGLIPDTGGTVMLPTSWASEPRRNSRSPASSSTPNARPISNWSTRRSPPRNSTIGSQRRSTASRTAPRPRLV